MNHLILRTLTDLVVAQQAFEPLDEAARERITDALVAQVQEGRARAGRTGTGTADSAHTPGCQPAGRPPS